jgi:hypothetical protein
MKRCTNNSELGKFEVGVAKEKALEVDGLATHCHKEQLSC